jgi:hypothetical protein
VTAISDKYAQLGGAAGFLGAETTGEIRAANGGYKQEFQNGTIYWHARTGAFEVHGEIRVRWLALGGEGSPFGYPISDESPARDGEGKFSNFENASVYWHPSTGAFEVHGLIRDRWQAIGGELSILGYPTTNESATPDGAGRYNHFQRGSIYWTPATGAHEVYGAVRARWAELRWERGLLGYPVSTPTTEVRARDTFLVAHFHHGRIEENLSTGEVYVEKLPSVASPNYEIPIVAFRVSDDDGRRACAISAAEVQRSVDAVNRVYAAAGVRFTFDGVLVDLRNTDVNSLPHQNVESAPRWPATKSLLNNLAAQRRAVVVIYRFGPDPTRPIGGGWSWWDYDFVAMSSFDPNWSPRGLAHELGHHFGLPHTHGREFATEREAEDYVLSGGLIEWLDGDRGWVDDTPPDPFIRSLQSTPSVSGIALGGHAFSFARHNIMSYWDGGPTVQLSHSQIDRVRTLVLERRSRYLNVTEIAPFDCAALMRRIADLQTRLDELIAERNAETDPRVRAQLAGAIARVRIQIGTLTNSARRKGCI